MSNSKIHVSGNRYVFVTKRGLCQEVVEKNGKTRYLTPQSSAEEMSVEAQAAIVAAGRNDLFGKTPHVHCRKPHGRRETMSELMFRESAEQEIDDMDDVSEDADYQRKEKWR